MSEPRRTDPRSTVGVFVREDREDVAGEKLTLATVLRSSNAIAIMRKENPHAAKMLEHLREQIGTECPVHGHIEDPIIGVLGGEVAFACPDCSGADVREQWANEGPVAP